MVFDGVVAMIRAFAKIAVWLIGGACALAAVLFVAFALILWDWGRSSSPRKERDQIVQQRASPDGTQIAEIHQITTGMWEGPDTLYVTIKTAKNPVGYKVYSRTYECGDYSAFKLEWTSPMELRVKYGECHVSPFNSLTELGHENKIWQSSATCGAVKIHYEDTHYIATR